MKLSFYIVVLYHNVAREILILDHIKILKIRLKKFCKINSGIAISDV